MQTTSLTPANLLSLIRLLLVPAIWLLAAAGEARAVGIGLIISGITDVLDGQLARRFGQVSALGSRLDAIADAAVNTSALGWLYLLRPEVVRDHVLLIVPLIALGIAAIVVGWVRFGRIADLHLPSGRAMAVAGYLFLVNLFLFDAYSRVLFFTMLFLAWIVASEALYVFCTRRNLDERVSSPLLSSLSGLLGGRRRARSPY